MLRKVNNPVRHLRSEHEAGGDKMQSRATSGRVLYGTDIRNLYLVTSTENATTTGMTLPSGYVPLEKVLVTPIARTFPVCTATLLPMAAILNLPTTVRGSPGGARVRSASC